ncbi:MAG: hypothetical protein JO061_04720, partial [Acidobacteriaceae bacterium]|nr:hypothetical protein [Acidobacteriaceae bacterium]
MRFTASASRLIVFTIAFGSLATAQQITPGKPLPSRVRITVHAGHVVRSTIPATIFGTFLEPIGNSTYGGLWAELLRNPSFESGLWDSRHVADMVRTDPLLTRASELGLPIPWEPLDATQGNRYEPRRGDAANSFESLAVFAVDNAETGVKQEIFLPAYRELEYRGSIFAQHLSGPPDLDISIRPRNVPDKILANAHVTVSSSDWTKYEFTLKLPPDAIAPLEPADFVISVRKATRIVVDQASLMPADAVDGIDPDMVRLSKEMHTPLLRFGGNFTSGYHWRDGIGPPDKRVSMRNIAWGMPEYNQFGTDEYLKFCELIGAQPQIALNLGSGTPEEAAEWVRYVDEHWTSHSGLLWELGNELWGNWNLGYPSLDELAERTLAFSKAIRAVDPSARLIATGQDPDHFEQWNAEELKDPANTFELLSTHFVVTTTEVVARHSVPDRVAEATFALPDEL